jgi:tetratricopeptide (TPR) repeat protein
MRAVWLLVLSVFTLQVQAAIMETITQTTTGSCSPAVAQVGGNVTITCQGLDEQALTRLNEFLDKKFAALVDESLGHKTAARLHQLLDKTELDLAAKIREAEEWAQKYRELEQRLVTQGQDEPLAQLAQALLKEGKLDEAGVILDRMLATGEKGVEQTAVHHFNRAEVYTLQFQPHKALPHYEKAYRYRPENVQYAFQYARTLQQQHHYTTASTVYQEALTIRRQLAQGNPQAHLPEVAMTLNNLGILRLDQENLQQAQTLIAEALTIRRVLWKHHAGAYANALAQSLAVEIMILQKKKEAVTLICERLHEMAHVARSENLKQWAQERTVKVCKNRQ